MSKTCLPVPSRKAWNDALGLEKTPSLPLPPCIPPKTFLNHLGPQRGKEWTLPPSLHPQIIGDIRSNDG